MTRISSRLSGVELTAVKNVNAAFEQIANAGLQLSTLKRINRASDDPAGLIAAEQLRSELESLEASSRSSARASAAVSLADAGLSQVTGLLNTVRDKTLEAAGGNLSEAELAANQQEIDAALEAVDRIGAYTGLSDGEKISFAPTGNVNDIATLEIGELNTNALGEDGKKLNDLRSGGALALSKGNYADATRAIDAARDQVLSTRAKVGSFERYTIDASSSFRDTLQVSLSESLSRIEDTDVAAATSQMLRGEILGQAAISSLRSLNQRHSLLRSLLDPQA